LPAEELSLSPEFEPEAEPHIKDKEEIFKDLLRLRNVGLVEPIGEEHMYHAAIHSRSCALTSLGKYYWRLVNEKKIEGITDMRDESDRTGMRVVIELKKDAYPEVVLNNLYKHTPMQDSFGVIMLALVDGRPRLLNLKELLSYFLEHRKEIITRATRHDLRKAEARLHILEGLKIALDHLDAVIRLIRASVDTPSAKQGLMDSFGLSEIQAQAILDMRLQRLTGLERDKIMEEHRETTELIRRLREILADVREVLKIIAQELADLRSTYGDDRRTQIVAPPRTSTSRTDRRRGHGRHDLPRGLREAEPRGPLSRATARRTGEDRRDHTRRGLRRAPLRRVDALLPHVLHDRGRVYWKVRATTGSPTTRGKAIVNMLARPRREGIAFLPVREFAEGRFVLFATARWHRERPASPSTRGHGRAASSRSISTRTVDRSSSD
jgi:DNA gyrase subunit A